MAISIYIRQPKQKKKKKKQDENVTSKKQLRKSRAEH